MAIEKFQFRGKTYRVEDVITNVLDKITSEPLNSWCKELVIKNAATVKKPDWDDKTAKLYDRDFLTQQWNDQLSRAKRFAVTTCLNKAFGEVIGGGCTNNLHAPESVDEIDATVIGKTLARIRSIRQGTVHRNYGNR